MTSINSSVIFYPIDIDYIINNDRTHVRIFGKTLKGLYIELHITDFSPYVYVNGSVNKIRPIINKHPEFHNWLLSYKEMKKKLYFGGAIVQVVRLKGKIPYQVPEIRRILSKYNLQTYEADIPFVKRFLIDNNIRILSPISIKLTPEEFSNRSYIKIKRKLDEIQNLSDSSLIFHPKFLAFDIEVDERGTTIQELVTKKDKPVTAISFTWGDAGDNYQSELLVNGIGNTLTEKELLTTFIQRITDIQPDILVSFNGTFFDIPYLLSRMEKNKINPGALAISDQIQKKIEHSEIPVSSYRIKGRAVVDLVPKTWSRHSIGMSGKKNLDTVAAVLLNERKIEINKLLGELWYNGVHRGDEEDLVNFKKYAMRDAELTYKLISKLGILDSIELCRLVGFPLHEGLLTTSRNVGEFELMRILFEKEIIIPSRPDEKTLQRRNNLKKKYPHLGGFVFDPEVSEATIVAIYDFKSLYPNLVRTYNISGETLNASAERLSSHQRFKKSPRGALSEIMHRILVRRYNVQNLLLTEKDPQTIQFYKKLQYSLKIMANSLYGGTNYPRGRFYHHLMSNTITEIARSLLKDNLMKWTEDFVLNNSIPASIVYGDTDSIFVSFKFDKIALKDLYISESKDNLINTVKEYSEKYRMFIESKLPSKQLELKLEDIALRIIFKEGRKKAYAYHSIFDQVTYIKGFEAVRSDWTESAKKAQRDLLNILLTDFSATRTLKARNLISNICKNILKNPKLSLIALAGPIKRDPSTYKSKTPAVGAFLRYCEDLELDPKEEYKNWDRFPYVITEGKGAQFRRSYHPEYLKGRKIDKDHYIQEILNASSRFGVNISLNEIKLTSRMIPLTFFFKK